jgi:Heparinase II/III-like protein
MAPCYAHGHADALAVTFHVGSHEVLLDPGTYTYTGSQQWRRYFRGTRAHNTVTVDGLDQAVQETAFLWTEPFRCVKMLKDVRSDGTVMIVSGHDGYDRRVGVRHWRAILYHPSGLWLICDRLVGDGEHSLELNWHLGVKPVVSADRYVVQCGEERLYFAVQGGAVSALRHGEEPSISGWQSHHYGVKERIFTLQTSYSGMLPHEFVTYLCMGDDAGAISSHISIVQRFIDEAQTC